MNTPILILDDEEEKRVDLHNYLKHNGYDVYPADTIEAAKGFIRAQNLSLLSLTLKSTTVVIMVVSR